MWKEAGPWLVVLAATFLAVPAGARTWHVDRQDSSITFSTTCRGGPCSGTFRSFDADVVYDPADPARARFDVRVDLGSLAMADSAETGDALGPAFLDAAKYPRAYLVTTRFRRAANGWVSADCELGLHGAIAPIVLTVVFTPTGVDRATLDIATRLRRSDFGIASDAPPRSTADDTVAVRGHLVLRDGQ